MKNSRPLHIAFSSLTNLILAVEEQAVHLWMVAMDKESLFFMVPLPAEDGDLLLSGQNAVHWLPQEFKHRPALSHQALEDELEQVPPEQRVKVCQYTDGIFTRGDFPQ